MSLRDWARAIGDIALDAKRFEHIVGSCDAGHIDIIRGGVSESIAGVADGLSLLTRLTEERASLRVRRIHILDDEVKELAFAAHRRFGEEININAYWSPPRVEMGLAPHRDPYDIVVVQLAGEKRWNLFEDPPRQMMVQAGDRFHLPRGLRHQAEVPGDAPSLHLAVGLYAKTTRSLVEWIAAAMSKEVSELSDTSISELRTRIDAFLADPEARERFAAHRRAVEYERMLMTPEEHARSDARLYR